MQSNSICLFSTPTCGTERSAHNPKTSIWVEFEIFLLHFCADPNGNKYKNVPFNQMSSFNATELFSHRLACSKFSYFFLLGCFINEIAPTTIDQRQNELTKNERVRKKSFKIKLSQQKEFTVFVVTTTFSHWNF